MSHTYGVTYTSLEPYLRAFDSLSAYAADVLIYAAEAGRYVDAALDKVGYDPDEVSARDASDELYGLCATIVALRAAAALVTSLTVQDTSVSASLFARSEEQLARIVKQPHAVSRDSWENDTNEGGVRVGRKVRPSNRFWNPGRRF